VCSITVKIARLTMQHSALGERIRDTAADVSDLARPVEPHSVGPALGLRWRASLVPKLAGEQAEHVPLRKVTAK
jgi:hypothetical protein